MQKTFVMLVAFLVTGLCFVACTTTNDGGTGGACGSSECGGASNEGSCGGEAPATDMADMMIKMYVDGQQKAFPYVVIHEFVAVGQHWETTSTFGGTSSVNKWQVTAKAAGTKSEFIVENDMGQGYVLAYQVNAWAEKGKANVSKAWIGKPGDDPQEIELMKWDTASGGTTGELNGIMLREDFGGLKMAGKEFEGELTIVKSDGNTTKTWIASNGWFSKVIKMEMNGDTVIELTGVGFEEKPKAMLKWEADKK